MNTPPLTPAETLHAVRTLLNSCVVSSNRWHPINDPFILDLWWNASQFGPVWERGQ